MKVVILDGATVVQDDLSWDGLAEFGELTYYQRTSPGDVISRINNAEAVITSKCIINKEVIDANPNIKYIGVIATGYNNVDIEYAKEKGIVVTNIPAYSTDSVAQFAFALLLEATNRIGLHNESVHSGDWNKSMDFCYQLTPQVELSSKTLGIVGYGNIGKKVASIAQAFGMRVLVYSSHIKSNEEASALNGPDNTSSIKFVSLDELLKNSDVVSLHCALNDSNKEMINRDSLKIMKNNAILVNTSRGPLINEEDLAEALNNGEIAMAALDVLPSEPPKNGSPLLGTDNCIITPHIAWITKEARQRLIDIATNNLAAFVSKKPINKIN